jgi:diadenosine tetraphosphatase ApaH/serine/threonine PP2A family protein phosphatase
LRIGILGDVHSNIEALDAVLSTFARERVDRVLAVGDLVGYGADPTAVLSRIRSEKIGSVLGNHDAAVVGELVDLAYFNVYARAAAIWTRKALQPDELQYLRSLPLLLDEPNFVIVHGSLDRPEEFNYIQTVRDAERSLAHQTAPLCFVGHSHIPIGFLSKREDPTRIEYTFDSVVDFAGFDRVLMNVGSVGQPRDEDPRAVAAIYDTDQRRVTLQRVAYDVDRAAGKILAAGLPRVLAERLRFGV